MVMLFVHALGIDNNFVYSCLAWYHMSCLDVCRSCYLYYRTIIRDTYASPFSFNVSPLPGKWSSNCCACVCVC